MLFSVSFFVFYVSSFMCLVLLKKSAFNAVLCFKFRVSGLAKKFGLQCCFMFQIFVFYVSSFMFLLQERQDKKVEPGRFEPRNPVLQASSLTPTPGGIAGQYSKNGTIYQKLAVSGFRFCVFECYLVSCFVLHVSCALPQTICFMFHVFCFKFLVSIM